MRARQDGCQCQCFFLPMDRRIARHVDAAQKVPDGLGRVLRSDLGDIAGCPCGEHALLRCQRKMERGAAQTAGIQMDALAQLPRLVARRRPVRHLVAIAELADVMLPMAQCAVIRVVHLDQIEQRLRALASQPVIQLMAECTEVGVLAVAQCQHRVLQAL